MPRFVLLEHTRDGVHWDFMLEAGDRLRTWAIDEPIRWGIDLPARALPDHRLAYLDYEGEISGGRGSVRRVDRGVYEILEATPASFRVRLDGQLLRGEAALTRQETGEPFQWVLRIGNVD